MIEAHWITISRDSVTILLEIIQSIEEKVLQEIFICCIQSYFAHHQELVSSLLRNDL